MSLADWKVKVMERDENGSGWMGLGVLEYRGNGDGDVVGDVEVNFLSVDKNPFDDCLLAS